MQIPGVVMLAIGVVGLLAVIIWILVDLIRRDKREEKIVKKAVTNTPKQPAKKSYNTPVSLQMTGGLSGALVPGKTEGLDRTAGLGETEAIGRTEALEETEALGKTEGLDRTAGLDETEAIGQTEALERTEALEETEVLTSALDKSSDLAERSSGSETAERKPKFCINCGAPLAAKGKYCVRCGFKNS